MKDRSKRVIVVPWDFSELATVALKEAMEMVDSLSQLKVINVCQPLGAAEPAVVYGNLDEHTVRSHTRDQFKESVGGEQFEALEFVVRFGDPGKEICRFADELGADQIVIPSHGRGWLGRMFIGSVAERVVRFAPCPVLVLRGNVFEKHGVKFDSAENNAESPNRDPSGNPAVS